MADDIRITSEDMELDSLTIGYSECTLTHSREAVEHELIQQTLKTTGATIARAASRLGVSRPTLRSVTK